MTVNGAGAAELIDERYAAWRKDPKSVSAEWRAYFRGFELGLAGGAGPPEAARDQEFQSKVEQLVYRYRDLGHLLACLDPLAACPTSHPLLELEAFGLTPDDLERTVHAPEFADHGRPTLAEVLEVLRDTYSRMVGVEYMHLQDPEEREWLRVRMESSRNRTDLDGEERASVLRDLVRATRFEEFLHKRYLGQTRFSLEGAETLIPLLRRLCRDATDRGVQQVILGMAHRGRLNVHVHLLGKSYRELFCQFEASYDPEQVPGGGDVKYHSGYIGEVPVGDGRSLRMVLPENPSHLESINPVVEGIARAFQDRIGEEGTRRVLPLLIHGDAAFPGQGIVAETLNCARLEGYHTGGTVHVVLNNQIGYTTLPEHARSTRYATDLAKMLLVPIFHVHGEHPEAVLHAASLALEYRTEFGKDAVLDLVCYRRHGHNEGDEPYFTQPLMYDRIKDRPPVYRAYADRLREAGEADLEELVENTQREVDGALAADHEKARAERCEWTPPPKWSGWEDLERHYSHEAVDTGVDEETLHSLMEGVLRVPEGFHLHEKLARIFERRRKTVREEGVVDWAGAESLAFASLVSKGATVRLSGEDSRRGTFSQRHSVWFDSQTGEEHCPLCELAEKGGSFHAYDSPLSEAAVMGFEYGYSTVDPDGLVLWEAQYGDFANGAQVIVDQFLASGEAKWQHASGLVLLLPHGYEGQGPDHSTGRLERFLQLCAEDNIQVCQPSTPAQYFHLLRRQLARSFRKPLVVFTPKSLLRHPEVISPLGDLAEGSFQEVLPDPEPASDATQRVLLCSGKVYYDLVKRRREEEVRGAAVIRLEQLYPFPRDPLRELASRIPDSAQWSWVQEEPRNMGGWTFVAPRLESVLERTVGYVGRAEAASPATGFPFVHRQEQESLLTEALGG